MAWFYMDFIANGERAPQEKEYENLRMLAAYVVR